MPDQTIPDIELPATPATPSSHSIVDVTSDIVKQMRDHSELMQLARLQYLNRVNDNELLAKKIAALEQDIQDKSPGTAN